MVSASLTQLVCFGKRYAPAERPQATCWQGNGLAEMREIGGEPTKEKMKQDFIKNKLPSRGNLIAYDLSLFRQKVRVSRADVKKGRASEGLVPIPVASRPGCCPAQEFFFATLGRAFALTSSEEIHAEIRRKTEEFRANFFVNRYVLHSVQTTVGTLPLCAAEII